MPDTEPITLPLGAQVLRKMHGALKALHGDVSMAAGALDECEAKGVIGEHLGAIETACGGMAKAFGKLYKGIDLEDEKPADDAAAEPDGKPDAEKPTEEKKPQITEKAADPEDDDEDDGDDMTPTEKAMILGRIRKAESKIRHAERLERVAVLKGR